MADAAERAGHRGREIFGATEVGSIASRRTAAGRTGRPIPAVACPGRRRAAGQAPRLADTVLDDAVEMLPAGGFRLLGRRSDVVKLGGRRASLAGLNRDLAAVAGVQDGVFVPPDADDHRASARMTALVVAPDATPPAILAALRDRIDPVFLPRRIVHVDRLPRNELGKLPRRLGRCGRPVSARRPARFTVPADHPSLPGHFPGRPIVPGVVLLDEALACLPLGPRAADAPSSPPRSARAEVDVASRPDAAGRVAFACAGGRPCCTGRPAGRDRLAPCARARGRLAGAADAVAAAACRLVRPGIVLPGITRLVLPSPPKARAASREYLQPALGRPARARDVLRHITASPAPSWTARCC